MGREIESSYGIGRFLKKLITLCAMGEISPESGSLSAHHHHQTFAASTTEDSSRIDGQGPNSSGLAVLPTRQSTQDEEKEEEDAARLEFSERWFFAGNKVCKNMSLSVSTLFRTLGTMLETATIVD
jgi:hypothetical protein